MLVEARLELERCADQLAVSNPELYRHLALYLQVLREGLLNAVQQACFHIATQVDPQRYVGLAEQQRQQLHRRFIGLVGRANSFLTVEQLAHLAGQIDRSQRRSQLIRQQKLLRALQGGAPAQIQASANPPTPLAEGSVHLGLSLPLGIDLFSDSSLSVLIPGPEEAPWMRSADPDSESEPEPDPEPDSESDLESETESEMVEALAAALSEALNETADGFEASRDVPWDGGQLPRHPVVLLRWLEGYEKALVQRLRNLSHALNVELLRHGVCTNLLPVTLLDAVLEGHVEPHSAPANVLRLQLPFAAQDSAPGMETTALLLRLTDLEGKQAKLRTCRSKLQQHRQEVRRMAQQYHRLERRVQALEAEQLWLQDISTARRP